MILYFFFSIRRRHTRLVSDWSSDVCSSDLYIVPTCQRLFTLETCCGYGYGPARDLHPLPRIFKGQRELTGRRRNRDAFQGTGPRSEEHTSELQSLTNLVCRLLLEKKKKKKKK